MAKYVAEIDMIMEYDSEKKTGNVHRFGFELCQDNDDKTHTWTEVEEILFQKLRDEYQSMVIVKARIMQIIEMIEFSGEYIKLKMDENVIN